MIFPLYILVQIVLWFVSGGKWPWLLKSTEIFMILSSADSYIAADIIGVFDRFLSDLVRGVFYPNRRNFQNSYKRNSRQNTQNRNFGYNYIIN